MRAILAAAIFCVLFGVAPAQARSSHYTGLSGPCQQAAHLGGPCGCVASEKIFGHSVRGLWSVAAWSQFPRTSPAPGMAAIWPGRHVEIVTVVNNGTVITSSGRHTSVARLVFVDPHGGHAPQEKPVHYAGHHSHYASHHHSNWTRVASIEPHGYMGF